MKPRPVDPVVALILDNADAARFGAVAAGIGEHDLADIVQESLEIAWRRAKQGAFTLPDDPEAALHRVRAYLYTAGKHQALYRMRSQRRVVYVAEPPEQAVAPLPCLEARSELRALAKRAPLRIGAEVYQPGASLFALLEHLYGDDVPRTTAEGRRERVRRARRK